MLLKPHQLPPAGCLTGRALVPAPFMHSEGQKKAVALQDILSTGKFAIQVDDMYPSGISLSLASLVETIKSILYEMC